jgi:hypothetical protein
MLSELGLVALQVTFDLHFQTRFDSKAKSSMTNLYGVSEPTGVTADQL